MKTVYDTVQGLASMGDLELAAVYVLKEKLGNKNVNT
jgi:hypothetical protein